MSERETMQIKNETEYTRLLCVVGMVCAACFLGACTKKEELLILSEEAGPETISETTAAENGEAKDADLTDASALMREDAVISRETETSAESSLIYVHVCGAVEAPGVYELPVGSRVYEVIQAAGGFSEKAEQSYVNQAQVLSDGVKLVIPTVEEAAAANGKESDSGISAEKSGVTLQIGIVESDEVLQKDAAGQSNTESVEQPGGRININTATKQELCTIPGVGETRAAAIIAYRESHGAFQKPEDIMKVSGIKEGMYERIKDSIDVN